MLNYNEKENNYNPIKTQKSRNQLNENSITNLPLNLKKSIFKTNYENQIQIINNSNIKNSEYKNQKYDLKISIDNIYNIIIIQRWWKKLFFIIKIQKNIRGYLMRKNCIQKLEKDYYVISLLVNIALIYKKIWLRRLFKIIIINIKRKKILYQIIKIYNKKIQKHNFQKWKHIINIIKNNKKILYEGIKDLIQIMKKKTLIFDIINIFQYIYEKNNTSINNISKSGTVYSIYNPNEISNSNLSIQYISDQKGSQVLNYESDNSKINDYISSNNISSIHSMNFLNNNSNIYFTNNNISNNYISNNMLCNNYSVTQTQNTINSFKLSENNTIKNNNNYYITQKIDNNKDEINENYFKSLYDKININSINHNKNNQFQKISTIIYKYFNNWKFLNHENKNEFHEIFKAVKNNKIKDKINNYFILWKYISNKNSTIYNQLLTKFKKTKTRKVVIHPHIIRRKNNNINNQIQQNNSIINNELLFNSLIKWNIKNKTHQTKFTLFKRSIIKSLIKLNNNNDKKNYVKNNKNNLIKEKIINCFYNILNLYKKKNEKFFLNKMFNQNKNLISMKNEKNDNIKKKRDTPQNNKKELDNYTEGKKIEKEKNKDEPKKSQRTLVFRFKKKNQINSKTFNVVTPEKNNIEQENFINENYEMMKNQMEKKNSYIDINLTTPQKKYKTMKKRNNLLMKNLDNSSYIEKEFVTIIKTQNGYVKKLNISKKKDNKLNYSHYDKLCKTEETFKNKTKNKIRNNLNLEDNQNVSNLRYTMKNKVSISPILKENRKSQIEIKSFEKNENNNPNNELNFSLHFDDRNNKKNLNKRKNTNDFLNLSENDNYNKKDNNDKNLSYNKFIDNKNKNGNKNKDNINDKIIILKKIILIYKRFILIKVIEIWKKIKKKIQSRNTSPLLLKNIFISKSNIIKDNIGINKINDENNKSKNKVSIVKKISNINMLTNKTLSLSPDNIKKYIKFTDQKSSSKSLIQINKTEKNKNSKEKNKNELKLVDDLQKKINNITNENLNQIHIIKENDLENNNSKHENKIKDDKYNKEIENISNYRPPQKIKEIVIENLNLNKQIIKEKEEQREIEKRMKFNRSFGSINQNSDLNLNNFYFDNNKLANNEIKLRKFNSTEFIEQDDFYINKNISHNQEKKTNSSKNIIQYKPPHLGMIFTKKTIPNSENQIFCSNSISNLNENKNPYLSNPFNLKSNITNYTSPNQNSNFINKIYMKRHPKNINKSNNNQQNTNKIIKESNLNNIKYPYTINNNIITNNITFSNPYNFFSNEIPKREKEHLQTVQSETITSSNSNTISVSSSYNNTISGISLIENHNEKLNSIKYTSQSFVVSKDYKNNIQNKNISLLKNPMKIKGNFENLIENDYNNFSCKNQRIQITNAQYPINNIINNKDNMKIDSKESRNYIMKKIIEKCDNDIYSSNNNEKIKKKNKHKKHFSISFPIKENTTKFGFHNLMGERNKNDSNKFELIQESKLLINSHSANNISLKRPFSPNSSRINKIEYKPLKITYKLKELNTNQYYHTSRGIDENKLLRDKNNYLEIIPKPYVYSIIKKSLNREKKNNYFSKKYLPIKTISQSPVQNRKNIISILNNNLDE